MGKVSRRDNEIRQAAMLKFFLADPTATGEEGQRALVSGQLTGTKGPPMGIGLLFKIRRQAEQLARQGAVAQPVARTGATDAGAIEELRKLTAGIQKLLVKMPDVTAVHITKASARLERQAVREEPL